MIGGYGFSAREVVTNSEVVLLLPLVAVAAPLVFRVVFVAVVARDSRPLLGPYLSIVHAGPSQKQLFLSSSLITRSKRKQVYHRTRKSAIVKHNIGHDDTNLSSKTSFVCWAVQR